MPLCIFFATAAATAAFTSPTHVVAHTARGRSSVIRAAASPAVDSEAAASTDFSYGKVQPTTKATPIVAEMSEMFASLNAALTKGEELFAKAEARSESLRLSLLRETAAQAVLRRTALQAELQKRLERLARKRTIFWIGRAPIGFEWGGFFD